MLTLLPFEAEFYRRHQVPVCFVGHPLASLITSQPDTSSARLKLGLQTGKPVLCIMPGSRAGEVERLADLFLDTASAVMRAMNTEIQLLIPAASDARHTQLMTLLASRSEKVVLLAQQSHMAMQAADVVLLASGTTALEAMLLKKPMVVSYRLGELTYKLVSRLIKTAFVSIPNLLAGRMLVPEYIQAEATVENLCGALIEAFDTHKRAELLAEYESLHRQIALDSGNLAATAIANLISDGKAG